jgi:ATP-binding cassette, subfamily C (CFTR/MRP), member 1
VTDTSLSGSSDLTHSHNENEMDQKDLGSNRDDDEEEKEKEISKPHQLTPFDGRVTVDEEVEVGSVGWDIYEHYLTKAGGPSSLIPVGFSTLISRITHFCITAWIVYWITDEIQKKRENNESDESNYLLFFVVLLVLTLASFTTSVAEYFLMFSRCICASKQLHDELLWSVLRAPMSFHHQNPQGRLLNRFGKDMSEIDTTLPEELSDLLDCGSYVVSCLLAVCFACPPFLLPFLPIAYQFYRIYRPFATLQRLLLRFESVANSPIYEHFSEVVDGLASIRAFGIEKAEFSRHLLLVDRSNSLSLARNRLESRVLMQISALSALVILGVSTLAILSSRGYLLFFSLPVPLLAISVRYSIEFTGALKWLILISVQLGSTMAHVQRVCAFSSISQEDELHKEDVPESWPEKPTITFENVNLKYNPKGIDVLKNVTFEIKEGEKIGVVGRTGAGKSSLLIALLRLFEIEKGNIVVSGRDLRTVGLHDLRHRISIIPQDPFLVMGTIRQNLDPFGAYNDHQIWEVLEMVNLKNYILNIGGLDALVSDSGKNFSAGQRQLVCIARSLLNNVKIFLLDEATSSVDHHTDAVVQKAMRSGKLSDRTIVTIAHRLETVIDSDRILVMDNGTVEAFDSPASLLGLLPGTSSSILKNFVLQLGENARLNLEMCALNSAEAC